MRIAREAKKLARDRRQLEEKQAIVKAGFLQGGEGRSPNRQRRLRFSSTVRTSYFCGAVHNRRRESATQFARHLNERSCPPRSPRFPPSSPSQNRLRRTLAPLVRCPGLALPRNFAHCRCCPKKCATTPGYVDIPPRRWDIS